MSAPYAVPMAAARRGVEDDLPPDPTEVDPQNPEVRQLSTQTEQLTQFMISLLRRHESERAQREALQATLERLIEQLGTAAEPPAPVALADEIRRGVVEDLQPLMHAIIDLLELSVGRVAPNPTSSPEAGAAAGAGHAGSDRDTPARSLPSDDLPKALPDILTKSVEELVSKVGAPGPNGGDGTRVTSAKGQATMDGTRASPWIPVTPGTPGT